MPLSPLDRSFPEEPWTTALDELSQRIKRHFVRSEHHQRALAYMQGLMSSAERKNGWQVAEEIGEATPYAVQHLLDRAKWDCDGVREELRAYIEARLADPQAVVVIDETGFFKKGRKSVGVQRQYSGTAGRIEKYQVGVFLSYASSHGHTLLDRELYLPKSWIDDQERCQQAHVPSEVAFATKPELARRMLERTLDSDLPVAWITGDTVYGSHRPLRTYLEERRQAYALGISCQEWVEVGGMRKRVDHFAQQIDPQAWHVLSCGEGSKGPRLYEWARLCTSDEVVPGWQQYLVIRRTLPSGAQSIKYTYFLVFAPSGTTLQGMVQVLGQRWTIEQCLELGKGEVGLDDYEVRTFHGWYRHITLSMLALAFLTALRASEKEDVLKKSEQTLQTPKPEATASPQARVPSDLPIMVPLSVAEIRRFFFRLVSKHPLSFAYHLAWSFWRRTHQAFARLCHYKRRRVLIGHLQL